jgi:hypothetical protein
LRPEPRISRLKKGKRDVSKRFVKERKTNFFVFVNPYRNPTRPRHGNLKKRANRFAERNKKGNVSNIS